VSRFLDSAQTLRRTLVTLPLALTLVACGPSHTSAHQDMLRLPLYTRTGHLEPGVTDPARFRVSTPIATASLLNAGLMKFGPDLHVIPDLAVSIPTISSGGKSYTFTIRQDARFADGTPCTGATVRAAWVHALRARHRSPLVWQYLGNILGAGPVSRGLASTLSGVRVTHRLTIRITLNHPDATFLQKLAFPPTAVVKYRTGRIFGLGPWGLAGRTPDGEILLRPRRHYYGGPLVLRSVALIPVASPARALELYRKNALDAALVPATSFALEAGSDEFHTSPSLDAYYALAPAAAGSALNLALSGSNGSNTLSPSIAQMTGLIPPSIPDYVSSSTPFPSAARRISALGHIVPTPPVDPAEMDLARELTRYWKPRSDAPVVRIVHASFLLPDPGRWISLALPRTRSRWFRYELKTANTLTLDPVSRMGIYNTLETWVLRHGYLVPLASGTIGFVIKPRVQSLQVTPVGLMPENNNWTVVSVS
jgi:hypothetical protein